MRPKFPRNFPQRVKWFPENLSACVFNRVYCPALGGRSVLTRLYVLLRQFDRRNANDTQRFQPGRRDDPTTAVVRDLRARRQTLFH